jgi:putative transposase
MAQSLSMTFLHIVFSTKYRQKLILPPVENDLHRYIAEICRELKCPAIQVGGYTDHIHILCELSRTISISKLLEQIKSNSSKWIKTQGVTYHDFFWQNGYGVFSVSKSDVKRVKRYIKNQHAHHSEENFEDEFIRLLVQHAVEYDIRYLWD